MTEPTLTQRVQRLENIEAIKACLRGYTRDVS